MCHVTFYKEKVCEETLFTHTSTFVLFIRDEFFGSNKSKILNIDFHQITKYGLLSNEDSVKIGNKEERNFRSVYFQQTSWCAFNFVYNESH